ncbi:MAG TPA: glycosyltransferase family 39 protein [Candidatus Polarisedimenticolia bacterium]|jgi:4-amino-4-deoxy-L-arabinose transferase-like glycosyltransferase|nr:glycosyltransferase family 39 protein [Candidatus Polarisedimenticolia bacterium]
MPRPASRPAAALKVLQIALFFLGGLAVLALLWPRGGLRAVYSVETESGQLVPVHVRIDPEVDFPTSHLLLQPFYQHWNLETLGAPATMPPFQIRWTGIILASRAGSYRFHVEASGQVRLIVDGTVLRPEEGGAGAAADLTAGWHSIDLTYRRGEEEPQVRLLWEAPGSAVSEPVPRSSLSASRAVREMGFLVAVAGWILLAAWLGAVIWIWRGRGRPGSLGAFVQRHRHGTALAALLLLGLGLRLHQYDLIPFHHETADEYQHGWEGWTLLHEGVPRAWSFYPRIYPKEDFVPFFWFGHPYNLSRPYFDHPPAFSLLVGGLSTLLGAEQLLDCTLWRMRLVPIFLSLLTLFLVARTGWETLGDARAGTLAALLYATLPTVVLGNRLVKAENMIAPLLLAQSLWLERYLRDGGQGRLLRIAASGFLSIWTKATGVVVPMAALLVMGRARRWKGTAIVGGFAIAAVLAYLAYGAFYGWDTFTTVMSLQASKRVAVRTLLDLSSISRIVELQFGTGWYLWLVVAAGWMALGPQRGILAPAALYFLVLSVTADTRGVYGWYRIPLYPFLCLAGGKYLSDWLREKDLSRGFLFAVTALAATFYYALPAGMERTRWAVWIVFALGCAAPLGGLLFPSLFGERLRAWAASLALAAFVAGNLLVVSRQLPIYLQEASRGKTPLTAAPASDILGRDD